MRFGLVRVGVKHDFRQMEYILGRRLVINCKDFEIKRGVVLLGLCGELIFNVFILNITFLVNQKSFDRKYKSKRIK